MWITCITTSSTTLHEGVCSDVQGDGERPWASIYYRWWASNNKSSTYRQLCGGGGEKIRIKDVALSINPNGGVGRAITKPLHNTRCVQLSCKKWGGGRILVSAGSLYESKHPTEKCVLKDNYGMGGAASKQGVNGLAPGIHLSIHATREKGMWCYTHPKAYSVIALKTRQWLKYSSLSVN